MSTFTDTMFSFKNAYEFDAMPDIPLDHYLSSELRCQLQDLEEHWVKMDEKKWGEKRTFSQEIIYQRSLERISFRLEELIRFLGNTNGPRIILFVCSEILDFLAEKRLMNHALSFDDIKQIEHILVVMNGFFLPEVANLKLMTQEDVSKHLKEAIEKLLDRYSGKNREESLKSLSKAKIEGNK